MEFSEQIEKDFKRIINGAFSTTLEVRKSGTETGTNVNAIWDDTYNEVDLSTMAQRISKNPRCTIWLGDLSFEPKKDDKVIKGGLTYLITKSESDGQGSSCFYLRKDA